MPLPTEVLPTDLPLSFPLHARAGGPWRTRFAPSPTGYLHLGHLVNAIHVWGMARAQGGEVLLRIEDHDRGRCRPEYERALLEDIEWLGLEADVCPHPLRQSDQSERYLAALELLAGKGLVYNCRCSRREIAEQGQPDLTDELHYPGTCRDLGLTDLDTAAKRIRLARAAISFDDLRLGPQLQEPWRQCGDLLVRDRHSLWTYQFCVVVDDIAHDIDVVIRGEDLLSSTGRQIQLAAFMGRAEPPAYLHHTLLRHPDGSKLGKARRDTPIRELRAAGSTAAELFGEAALRAGLLKSAVSLEARDLPSLFAS